MPATNNTEDTRSDLAVYFFAVPLILLGGLLGFLYMTTFPAQVFASEKDYKASLVSAANGEKRVHSKPGDVYYIEGSTSRNRSWQSKRELIKAVGPQTIHFSADEMNGWISAKLRIQDTEVNDAPNILIVPGLPKVGLVNGKGLFLKLPVAVTAYGGIIEYVVSVFFNLESSRFKIESVNINSARVPFPDVIGSRVISALLEGYKSIGEYKIISSAFERIDSATVEDGHLVLLLR